MTTDDTFVEGAHKQSAALRLPARPWARRYRAESKRSRRTRLLAHVLRASWRARSGMLKG